MAKKIYIIAGENSGDLIGSKLMSQLKNMHPSAEIRGIGGNLMQKQGLYSLFPMEKIAIMGLVEVLGKVFTIQKLIKRTILDIQEFQPDIVITIDSLGFNKRVAIAIKKTTKAKLIHYVAPTVWAWKPQRAKEIAGYFDYLLCLFDFEVPYFKKEGLTTFAVGHPIIESGADRGSKEDFIKKYNFNTKNNAILLMPGSRLGEVKRLLPIFIKVATQIQQLYPDSYFIMPTVSHLKTTVEEYMKNTKLNYLVLSETQDKYNSFTVAKFALVASGTVTLELSLAKIPAIVAYKVNFITGLFAHFLIKIRFASIVNIIANREIIKEFIQQKCKATNITPYILKYLQTNQYYTTTDSKKILDILYNLGYNNFVPSEKATTIISTILNSEK